MLLPLLVFVSFTFPGGTAPDLVRQAGEATEKAVVIMGDRETPLRAAKFGWESAPDFAAEMRSYFGFRSVLESEWQAGTMGFGRAWPVALVAPATILRASFAPGQSGQETGEPPEKAPPRKATDGPKVSIVPIERTEKGFTTGDGVAFGPAAEFVQHDLHWFLQTVEVAVFAKDTPPEELRAAVLTAVGADDKGQPRWGEFRTRYVAGLNEALKEARKTARDAKDPRVQSLGLKSSVIAGMRDADMQKAFASNGASVTMAGNPGTPLYRAAWSFAAGMGQMMANKGGSSKNPSDFDPRKPVTLTFTSPAMFTFTIGDKENSMRFALP